MSHPPPAATGDARVAASASATGAALARARAGRRATLRELQCFASFPTISADPASEAAMRQAATWLAMYLRRIGLQHARVLAPGRRTPPLVYADWCHAPARPTVLIYGHYDVQPADPVADWHSAPFRPTVRGDRIYARGITDDKGQLFAHLAAVQALLRSTGSLPVNVRVIVEGEEEIGSPHFGPFVARHAASLRADACIVSDTPMLGPDRPALTYSLRGGLSLEVDMRGQRDDLHSGLFGGAVLNPLQATCELVASLHNPDGRIAVDGFYDDVQAISAGERGFMRTHGPTDAQILHSAGATIGWGEPGYSAYERTTVRPSLSVNGVIGGYQGQGGKAVIPSRATVKLNARLVPHQSPRQVYRALRRHIERATPSSMHTRVCNAVGIKPVVLNRHHPATAAAAAALRRAFGAQPAFVRNGGTIAAVAHIQEHLRVPVVLMGFALPDARLHAPDENLHLPTFYRSIDAAIWLLTHLAHPNQLEHR